jgi:uncharacterized circularly permuted ATP-grasp superfamily protein
MSEQHTERTPAPLRGYRVLSDEEKGMVDRIKLAEAEIGKLWAEVMWDHTRVQDASDYAHAARDLFRQAFMELVRTVTKPLDVYGDELRARMRTHEESEDDRG